MKAWSGYKARAPRKTGEAPRFATDYRYGMAPSGVRWSDDPYDDIDAILAREASLSK